MGADGYIPDPTVPAVVYLICHGCGKGIVPHEPIRFHEHCLDAQSSLAVDLAYINFERR